MSDLYLIETLAVCAHTSVEKFRADIDPEVDMMSYLGGYYDALMRTQPRVFTETRRNLFERTATKEK